MRDEKHFHVLGIPWSVGSADFTVPDTLKNAYRGSLKHSVGAVTSIRDEIAIVNQELLC